MPKPADGGLTAGRCWQFGSKWAVIRMAPSLIPLDLTACSDPPLKLPLDLELTPHWRLGQP